MIEAAGENLDIAAPVAGRLLPSLTIGLEEPAAIASSVAEHWSRQMKMVLSVSRLLAVPTELLPLLRRIAELTTEILDCERASIFLHDASTSELWTQIAISSREIRVPCTAGIVGHAFTNNQLVLVSDPYSDSRFNPEPDRRSGFVTRNLLTCPMVDLEGKPLGVIQAVNKRHTAFTDHDPQMIQLLADQAGVAIQRHRLQLAAMETAALRHEMSLAQRLQQALIPAEPPQIEGIDAIGWTLAASTTGGDCFDLWRTEDGRLGVLVADASGHGLGPAMMVTQARTLVRALCEYETSAHDLLARVNARLNADLQPGQFITAFLGLLSADGTLDWSSAGHGPVLVRRRRDSDLEPLEPPAPPLGVIHPWDDQRPESLRLEPGGAVFIVSDGIFESKAADGQLLGVERMQELIERCRDKQLGCLLNELRDLASNWRAGSEPDDDQTIVLVQRRA